MEDLRFKIHGFCVLDAKKCHTFVFLQPKLIWIGFTEILCWLRITKLLQAEQIILENKML